MKTASHEGEKSRIVGIFQSRHPAHPDKGTLNISILCSYSFESLTYTLYIKY